MLGKGKKTELELQRRILYQEQVLVPVYWIQQADELIQASKKLEPSIKKYWLTVSKYFDPKVGTYSPPAGFKPKRLLQSAYFMLVAYACENYFKAILIAENKREYGQYILNTGNLPVDLKRNGHDLIRLVRQSHLNLTQDELSLLTRLFRHSVWQGRYPVPGKAEDFRKPTRYDKTTPSTSKQLAYGLKTSEN